MTNELTPWPVPKPLKCEHAGADCSEEPTILMLYRGRGPYAVCHMHSQGLLAVGGALGHEVLTHPLYCPEDLAALPELVELAGPEAMPIMDEEARKLRVYADQGHMSARFLCRLLSNKVQVPAAAMVRANETIRANLEFERTLKNG